MPSPLSGSASNQLKWAGWAITLYAGWNTRSILDAWQHSPFDHWDGPAWIVWMIPVGISLYAKKEVRIAWLGTALALTLGGALLDLNLLKHLAFAIACAGLTAPRSTFWIWLPAAVTWMPALGWLFSKYDWDPTEVGLLRLALAFISTISYILSKR